MKTLPALYSRRSDMKTQVVVIEVDGNKYRTTSGILLGRQVISEWKVCEGKNIGRANETSPEQQAMAEAQAKWEKKKSEKYSESVDVMDAERLQEPMRAKEFKDHVKKLFNDTGQPLQVIFTQRKLDGIRATITKDGAISRKGKKFFDYPHIQNALRPLFEQYPDVILDGEFFNADLNSDFEKIVSLVKKQTPTKEQIKEAQIIQFHVYDLASSPNKFSTRMAELDVMLPHINYSNNPDNFGLPYKPIERVETYLINSKGLLDELYEKWLNEGYEGQMVRTDIVYQWKRTDALLKRKEFIDAEFIIDGIFEGKGNKSRQAGYVTLANLDGTKIYAKNGEQAKANIKASWGFCKRLLADKDKIIGTQGTVKFFRYNETGAPYLPRLIRLRDYE